MYVIYKLCRPHALAVFTQCTWQLRQEDKGVKEERIKGVNDEDTKKIVTVEFQLLFPLVVCVCVFKYAQIQKKNTFVKPSVYSVVWLAVHWHALWMYTLYRKEFTICSFNYMKSTVYCSGLYRQSKTQCLRFCIGNWSWFAFSLFMMQVYDFKTDHIPRISTGSHVS
jgi:hypothetical protein